MQMFCVRVETNSTIEGHDNPHVHNVDVVAEDALTAIKLVSYAWDEGQFHMSAGIEITNISIEARWNETTPGIVRIAQIL